MISLLLNNNNKITDEGIKYMVNLNSIYLRDNKKITEKGKKYLSNLIKIK